MAAIKQETVKEYWVSTILLGDTPYPFPNYSGGKAYETAVFSDAGKIIHTEFSSTQGEAEACHDLIVVEISVGKFEPNGEDYSTIRARIEENN